MSDAQQARLDRDMLRSMSASLSSGLAFSFHSQDMADLLFRMSEIVDPKPRLADRTTPTLAEALAVPEVAALVEAATRASRILRRYGLDGGLVDDLGAALDRIKGAQ